MGSDGQGRSSPNGSVTNNEQRPKSSNTETPQIHELATEVRDQDDLERDVGRQADQMLNEQANERDQKRLEKSLAEKSRLESQIKKQKSRLVVPTGSATSTRIHVEIERLERDLRDLAKDIRQIQERVEKRQRDLDEGDNLAATDSGNRKLPGESQREFLIRTGKITPFSKLPGASLLRSESSLQGVLLDAEQGEPAEADADEGDALEREALSHQHLVQPGFQDVSDTESSEAFPPSDRPVKRRRLVLKEAETQNEENHKGTTKESDASSYHDTDDQSGMDRPSEVEGDNEETSSDTLEDAMPSTSGEIRGSRKRLKSRNDRGVEEDLIGLDDGNERLYTARVQKWAERRSAARKRVQGKDIKEEMNSELSFSGNIVEHPDNEINGIVSIANTDQDECFMPHPTSPDFLIDGGYRVPGDIHPSLFHYQKIGVQWLWELYSQQVGGIVGDEMGLGKTIQVIAFLAGLHYSKRLNRPIIIVAPATVMKQWVKEFHKWWPAFRVSILHSSGSGMVDLGREAQREENLESVRPTSRRKPLSKAQKAAKQIVNRVLRDGHVLITTYSGLQNFAELLIPVDWEYAVLDEGHKIRNPNASITIYCKELRTANRIILSGTPMQNNLVELWSLFDFIFPMRLGTLVNFRNQFEIPIRQGGYANATNLQVQTAMKCAETLKDAISPYLIQRVKADVASDLPNKSEKILFCKLTQLQRESYESYLASDDLKAIVQGKRQVLAGVDILRKICNHPDLQDHRNLSTKAGYEYGSPEKSGKMQVVRALLESWKSQGHKTLLFAQHRIMLDILQKFISGLQDHRYLRLDGNTPIQDRQSLVDRFNDSPDVDVFLLTTKVGGLGINLTGANRVIIFDPDWNPSTDAQARERAWRLGQKREVLIFRLMTAGTIEEKIYHRQLFKTFLTNKILKDPKQRQTFQMQDLHDLFTLGGADELHTETSSLFRGTEVKVEDGHDTAKSSTTAEHALTNGSGKGEDEEDSIGKLDGVASLQRYESGQAEHKARDKADRVMEGIFARGDLHSALEHDQIVNGKRVIAADPRIVEREAKKIAAQAARELRKASETAKNVPAGTPTWTGLFGTAGKPEESQSSRASGRGRGGPSSSSILLGLQRRQGVNEANSGSNPSAGFASRLDDSSAPRGIDFMKLIRDYIKTQGGSAHTQMLIDHFNRYCRSPEKTLEFKEMLKELATLEKGSHGRGRWVLKEEYREAQQV